MSETQAVRNLAKRMSKRNGASIKQNADYIEDVGAMYVEKYFDSCLEEAKTYIPLYVINEYEEEHKQYNKLNK